MQLEDEALEAGDAFTRLLMQNQRRFQGLVLSLVPNGPDADARSHFALAQIHMQTGNLEGALEQYSLVVKLEPDARN